MEKQKDCSTKPSGYYNEMTGNEFSKEFREKIESSFKGKRFIADGVEWRNHIIANLYLLSDEALETMLLHSRVHGWDWSEITKNAVRSTLAERAMLI